MGSEGYSNSPANQKDPDTPPISWNATIDHLFAKWCDHAKCFEWMHAESFDINYRAARRFMVSINVLTAIAGLSNVIAGNLTIPNTSFQVNWIFGGISIGISTLNMLQDKLGYQQIADQHKKYASQWAQITSKIEEMLSLPANARRDCKTFLKMIKADMNQVSLDGNSLISDKIRDECYNKFKDIPNFDIPEICGKMSHTNTYNDLQITATVSGNNDPNTGDKTTIKINTPNSPLNGNPKSKTTIKAIPSKKLIDINNASIQQTTNFNQVDTPPDSPTNNSSKPDSFVIGSFTNDVKLAIDSIVKDKTLDTIVKDVSNVIEQNTNSSSILSTVPALTELVSNISATIDNKINNTSTVSTVPELAIDTSATSVALDNKTNSNSDADNESNNTSDADNDTNNGSTLISIIDTSNQHNPPVTSNQSKVPISSTKPNSRKTKK